MTSAIPRLSCSHYIVPSTRTHVAVAPTEALIKPTN